RTQPNKKETARPVESCSVVARSPDLATRTDLRSRTTAGSGDPRRTNGTTAGSGDPRRTQPNKKETARPVESCSVVARSPDLATRTDLRSRTTAGSGDPRRTNGTTAGSGDPRRTNGTTAGSGDPRRTNGTTAGSGDPRRTQPNKKETARPVESCSVVARSPDLATRTDLRSRTTAGSGDPRRTNGTTAGSGDPRRTNGTTAGSGDPRRTQPNKKETARPVESCSVVARSPDLATRTDLRSRTTAGSGDPRRTNGTTAGSGDPRRTNGTTAGSGDPRRTQPNKKETARPVESCSVVARSPDLATRTDLRNGTTAGSGDPRRTNGTTAGSGDPRRTQPNKKETARPVESCSVVARSPDLATRTDL